MRTTHWLVTLGILSAPLADAGAQDHTTHMQRPGQPTEAGHAAFATIKEIVAILESDPTTDWSRVNLEALRQHLITMDRVMMDSRVSARPVAAGMQLDVTGTGEVPAAIREILSAHSDVLGRNPSFRSATAPLPDGIRLTVTARNPSDERVVARIRGLGFAGLLATDDHHTVHHLAIARGDVAAHRH